MHMPLLVLTGALAFSPASHFADGKDAGLTVRWEKNFLRIGGRHVPGGEIEINYLEAYCRPHSNDLDWGQTVIPHVAEKLSVRKDGTVIKIRDVLRDAVS